MEIAIDKEKKLTTSLSALASEVSKTVEVAVQIFSEQIVQIDKAVKFTWSPTLKGTKIKITDGVAEQTATESSGQRFALM